MIDLTQDVPSEVMVLLNEVHSLESQREIKKAEEIFERLEEKYPDVPYARYLSGLFLIRHNDDTMYKRASNEFKAVFKAVPDTKPLHKHALFWYGVLSVALCREKGAESVEMLAHKVGTEEEDQGNMILAIDILSHSLSHSMHDSARRRILTGLCNIMTANEHVSSHAASSLAFVVVDYNTIGSGSKRFIIDTFLSFLDSDRGDEAFQDLKFQDAVKKIIGDRFRDEGKKFTTDVAISELLMRRAKIGGASCCIVM